MDKVLKKIYATFMEIRAITIKGQTQYTAKLDALLNETFPVEYTSQGNDYSHWFGSPFYFSHATINENDQLTGYASFIFTTKQTYEDLIAGRIQEHEITPFPEGSLERPYLYWPTVIIKERSHTPYLFRNAFKAINQTCEKWELKIDRIYNIALSPISDRLLRRYGFSEIAKDKDGCPILESKVDTNPHLYAMLPYQVK